MNLENNIQQLFSTQRETWKLLDDNYNHLSTVKTRSLVWGSDTEVVLHHNSSRYFTASNNTDESSINKRKCSLCGENRLDMQQGIPFLDKYMILCNPFPILQNHLTISLHSHVPQLIGKKIVDMLSLAELLPNYIVFYNGAKCGATVPNHFHFEAGLKTKTLLNSENSLRSCFRIEGDTKKDAEEEFYYVFDYLKTHQPDEEEPMMNIISFIENKQFIIHVFPRKAYRPQQYSSEGIAQLMVNPEALAMAGEFIIPRKEDFDKINKNDIEDIYTQVSMAII